MPQFINRADTRRAGSTRTFSQTCNHWRKGNATKPYWWLSQGKTVEIAALHGVEKQFVLTVETGDTIK